MPTLEASLYQEKNSKSAITTLRVTIYPEAGLSIPRRACLSQASGPLGRALGLARSVMYRDTSIINKSVPLGLYRRTMLRARWWPRGVGIFL